MNTEARIGLIIPSSNRLTEPQFHAYAPPGVGIHVTRLRMTGKWRKPFSELKGPLAEAAAAISDANFGLNNPRANIFSDEVLHGWGARATFWEWGRLHSILISRSKRWSLRFRFRSPPPPAMR